MMIPGGGHGGRGGPADGPRGGHGGDPRKDFDMMDRNRDGNLSWDEMMTSPMAK
jgi:hypothetical protein